ncbi:hypothetical protein NDA14_005709 [Ustilago hordei]|nr:hypothetical protein NDA14_005709 [Ustilago hordei]
MATQIHHRDGAAMSAGAEDGEDAQQHQQQLWLDNFMRMLLHDVEMQGNIFKPTSDQARIALFYNQLDDADKEWLEQRYGRPCPALRSSTGQPYRRKGPASTQVAQPSFPNIYRIIADYIDHISSDDTCAPRSTGSVSSSQHRDHLNTATPASLASSAGVTRSLSPLIPPPPFGAERPLTSVRCTAPPPPPPPPESIASGACNLLQAVHAQLDQRSQALQGIVVQLVADHQLSDSQKLERLDLLCSQYQLCISAAALDANRHTPLPRGLHQAQAELVRRLGGFSLPTTTFALGDKRIPPQAQTQTQSPSLQRPSSNHGGRVSLQEEHVRNPSDAQASEVEAMRRQQHRATHALASLRATLFPTNASGRASPCASGSTSWHGIATSIELPQLELDSHFHDQSNDNDQVQSQHSYNDYDDDMDSISGHDFSSELGLDQTYDNQHLEARSESLRSLPTTTKVKKSRRKRKGSANYLKKLQVKEQRRLANGQFVSSCSTNLDRDEQLHNHTNIDAKPNQDAAP